MNSQRDNVPSAAFACVVILFSLTSAAVAQPPVGPLVGQASSTTVSLWMHAAADADIQVHYRTDIDGFVEQQATLVPISAPTADKVPGQTSKVTLTGLQPNTSYIYRIAIDGQQAPQHVGVFRTAPMAGERGQFRMALTSCMKVGEPQASWYLLLAQQPDFHLTLGDTHYADTTEPNVQWEHHLRYRRLPEFATVIRSMPTFAMWDDHDYGPNNSDGTAAGKENSLASWKQIWCNPPNGTDETPGAFFKFSWGDVDFFVVDGRYHRSPDDAPDNDQKRMLGDAQFDWLMDGLQQSKASFKVIASGSTLNHSSNDGWRIYTYARHRLFDAIRKNKISGVLYMSGDIHNSLVWEHPESERVGYPLVEVISSGVANSRTLSFATIDFDTDRSDPRVRVRVVHGDGTVQGDRTWRRSQLEVE